MKIYWGLYELDSGDALEIDLTKKELKENIKWYSEKNDLDKRQDLLVSAYLYSDSIGDNDPDDFYKIHLAHWYGDGTSQWLNEKYCDGIGRDFRLCVDEKKIDFEIKVLK